MINKLRRWIFSILFGDNDYCQCKSPQYMIIEDCIGCQNCRKKILNGRSDVWQKEQ